MANTETTANVSDPSDDIDPGRSQASAAAAASGYHRPASLPPVLSHTPTTPPGDALAFSATEREPAGHGGPLREGP